MPEDIPPEKKSSEQIHWDLKPEFDEVQSAVGLNQRVFEAVQKELGRIAREAYPGMQTYWQAKQLRGLAERISRHASDFSIEISDLDYAAEQSVKC